MSGLHGPIRDRSTNQPIDFFFRIIHSGDAVEIGKLMHLLRTGTEGLVKSSLELVYYFRGALQYQDALLMSPAERDLALEFVNERLEQARKMPYPVF